MTLSALVASAAVFAMTVQPFSDGERVTFLGDSITHGGGYHVDLQLYWDLRHPGSRTRLMNCGVSGGRANEGAIRWDWDVEPQKADRVFVMFGMNDVERWHYDPPEADDAVLARRAKAISAFELSMSKVLELVRKSGRRPVVMTPTPYDEYGTNYTCAAARGCNEPGLSACAAICRRLAANTGAETVELHRPLTEFLKREGPYAFCRLNDRVHPQGDGHLIVMAQILKAMGEPSDFGGADIDAKGCEKVEFRYEPKALPFPVSADYQAADRVYPLTDALNREMLSVRNLPAGRYVLSADGRPLGEFTDGELLAGVNLALLPTPNAHLAKTAWEISRELLSAQATLRSLVMVEMIAVNQGADHGDFDDVCRKASAFVERQRTAKSPYLPYYESQLNDYKANKVRAAEFRAKEEDARKRLRDIGQQAASWTIGLAPVFKGFKVNNAAQAR